MCSKYIHTKAAAASRHGSGGDQFEWGLTLSSVAPFKKCICHTKRTLTPIITLFQLTTYYAIHPSKNPKGAKLFMKFAFKCLFPHDFTRFQTCIHGQKISCEKVYLVKVAKLQICLVVKCPKYTNFLAISPSGLCFKSGLPPNFLKKHYTTQSPHQHRCIPFCKIHVCKPVSLNDGSPVNPRQDQIFLTKW